MLSAPIFKASDSSSEEAIPLPPSIQDRPEKEGSNVMYGMYNILSENIEIYDHFIVNNLKMMNNAMGEGRHRPTPKMRRS